MSKSVHEIYKEIDKNNRFATYRKRILAGLLDMLVIAVVIFFLFSSHVVNGTDSFYSQTVRILLPFFPIIYLILAPLFYENTVGRKHLEVNFLDYKTERKITFVQSIKRESLHLISLIIVFLLPLILSGWIFDHLWNIGEYVSSQWTYIALYTTVPIYLFWLFIDIVSINFTNKNRSIQDYIAGTMPVGEY